MDAGRIEDELQFYVMGGMKAGPKEDELFQRLLDSGTVWNMNMEIQAKVQELLNKGKIRHQA